MQIVALLKQENDSVVSKGAFMVLKILIQNLKRAKPSLLRFIVMDFYCIHKSFIF